MTKFPESFAQLFSAFLALQQKVDCNEAASDLFAKTISARTQKH